jgi:hypothetical protein
LGDERAGDKRMSLIIADARRGAAFNCYIGGTWPFSPTFTRGAV